MNHQNEKYLFGKGINVFVVMFFLSLLTFFSSTNLYSQNIISRDAVDYPSGFVNSACATSPYTGCIITLPPAKYGESYSFAIPLKSGIVRSDINFIFNPITNCSEGAISFTSDGKVEMLAASSCRPEINNFVEIDLNTISNSDGTSDAQKYYLPILRDPIKVVLVLDMSGSMSLPVPGGTIVRWQVLKNAVELFVQKLEAFKQDRDSVGVTYFSTELTQPGSPIGSGFIAIDTTVAPRSSAIIQSDMLGKGPTYLTAMGKGLLNAKLKLNDNNPINARKLVLLFTDGLQNVEPLVNPDGITLSPGSYALNNGPCAALDSVHYYTIGMGDITLVPEILGQIAKSNGGVSLTTITGANEGEIYDFFQDQFANMLTGSSPQVVSRKTGFLSASGTTYSFPINGNVSKLYFEFINPDAANATFKLEKGGKDLTAFAKITSGTFYKTLNIPLPILTPELVNSEGDWNLTISGNSSKKFSLACFVDDHFVSFSCQPQKSVYTVGDTLVLNASLQYAGKPLTGDANKVQVVLLKPGDDLGDLLATYTDRRTDSLKDVEPGAETKFLHLMQSDSSFYKELLPTSQVIDLTEDGAGVFKGSYRNTDLTGTYQLMFMVNGEVPGAGKFERQKKYSAVFKFGQISERSTEIDATISTPPASTTHDNNGSIATITIKPKNKFGYYLGPGYLSRIKLTVDPKQGRVKSAKDNLNGSYTFVVTNIPLNVKPDVRINVMGELLYQGKFPTPRIHFWQYLIFILLVLLLFFRYVNAHTGKAWVRTLVWILIILWAAFMILQKLGIIHI